MTIIDRKHDIRAIAKLIKARALKNLTDSGQ
jgi:hypothetical protein